MSFLDQFTSKPPAAQSPSHHAAVTRLSSPVAAPPPPVAAPVPAPAPVPVVQPPQAPVPGLSASDIDMLLRKQGEVKLGDHEFKLNPQGQWVMGMPIGSVGVYFISGALSVS
jgi:hypothetical protein